MGMKKNKKFTTVVQQDTTADNQLLNPHAKADNKSTKSFTVPEANDEPSHTKPLALPEADNEVIKKAAHPEAVP